jgi:hypothetical protein
MVWVRIGSKDDGDGPTTVGEAKELLIDDTKSS